MQRYTIYLFLRNALHVSGGSDAQSSGAQNCTYSIRYFVKSLLLPVTVVEEMERQFHFFHDGMLPHNRTINNDVISPNVLT